MTWHYVTWRDVIGYLTRGIRTFASPSTATHPSLNLHCVEHTTSRPDLRSSMLTTSILAVTSTPNEMWCVVWCGVVWCGVVWCGVVCRVTKKLREDRRKKKDQEDRISITGSLMYRTYMYGTLEGQSLADVHRSVHCASEQGREQAGYEHP